MALRALSTTRLMLNFSILNASRDLRNSASIRQRSISVVRSGGAGRGEGGREMGRSEVVTKAEMLMEEHMRGNDASHDAWHVFRVRDLALSLAGEEGLASDPDSMEIVELAALLHDIGDYKYLRDPSEEKIVENFLEEQGVEESKKIKILRIVRGMGFKNEIKGLAEKEVFPEFGVVQDADRLDTLGAIGIARCFTFGGSRNKVLHDPAIQPRSDLSQESYMKKEEQTTLNHFYEKLLKLKDLMKTKAGRRRAEKRHKFMLEYLEEFHKEWDGRA
ncbi:HD domain-containing protein [Psidium guajava]|nr:HD domain-containing protein [Psidium guajava]